jgi:methylphosphotriester-DNA--protein-cysteine methyltransferase
MEVFGGFMQGVKRQVKAWVFSTVHEPIKLEDFQKNVLNIFLLCYSNPKTTIVTIAEKLEVNERTLRRICISTVGVTPSELLSKIRSFHACVLIDAGMDRRQAWSGAGFVNSRVFKASCDKFCQ